MPELKRVPEYVRVSKDEYRQLRRELERTASASAFDFRGVWNLMIDLIEERHALVLAGKRKTELTLTQAVADMQVSVIQERAKMEQEKALVEAEQVAQDPEGYVRDLARHDAKDMKGLGLVP